MGWRGSLRAALHNCARLSVDGALLFATNGSGHVVLTFGGQGVEAKLDLYDASMVWIRCERAPAEVLVDGRAHAFTYEADKQCVLVNRYGPREVSIVY